MTKGINFKKLEKSVPKYLIAQFLHNNVFHCTLTHVLVLEHFPKLAYLIEHFQTIEKKLKSSDMTFKIKLIKFFTKKRHLRNPNELAESAVSEYVAS